MFVNKIGKHHMDFGQNNQDFGIIDGNVKVVCDGCGSGEHTEVGAKLFCEFVKSSNNLEIGDFFDNMKNLFGNRNQSDFLKNYLSFTILMVEKRNTVFGNNFDIYYCGDGYIIYQSIDGEISFKELKCENNSPAYYVYNFIDNKYLTAYKDGVLMKHMCENTQEYKKIGIATDGLRFLFGSDIEDEFMQALKENKEVKIKRLINMHPEIFKDDITIAF